MATRIWDYVIPAGEGMVNKIEKAMNADITPEVYTGPITKEMKDYEAYKQNPGDLGTGLSEVEWKEAVRKRTGDYPIDLGPVREGEKKEEKKEEEEEKKPEEPIAEIIAEKGKQETTSIIQPSFEKTSKLISSIMNGDFSEVLPKDKDEKMIEVLGEIKEILLGNKTLQAKSNKLQELNIIATANVVDVTRNNGQLIAATSTKNYPQEKEVRRNSNIAGNPVIGQGTV